MEQKRILEGYSDLEKGAYLGAIASLATADRSASEEELDYLDALSEAAGLSEPQQAMIRRAATELTDVELEKCLDVLKGSDLRFSLITDMIAFAESDQDYSQGEKDQIEKIARYLNVNKEQFSLLDQFAHKAKEQAVKPEEAASPNYLSSNGFGDKMKNAGIDTNSLLKGLVGVMGPIMLAGMLSGGRRRRGSMMGGGMMGGMLGGGGMFGGGGYGMGMGGGLGSLIGMLGGRRGSYRRRGGLFGF